MDPIFIVIIVLLCQYPIALLTLLKLFRCGLKKSASIAWNCVVVLVPFLGAFSFWIYYFLRRKKMTQTETNTPVAIEGEETKIENEGSENTNRDTETGDKEN